MPQTLNLSISGLYTDPNQLAVPDGALARADNVVINRLSVAETRRGQKRYGTTLGSVLKLFQYQDTLIANYENKLARDDDDAGTWLDYSGTFTKPDGATRMRDMEANRNFYVTTNQGIKKLDQINSEFRDAGVIASLGSKQINVISDPNGFLPVNSAVAYRVVLGYRDANNNELLGAPSPRSVAQNDSLIVAAMISGQWCIPSGLTTQYFYQLYRSPPVTPFTVEPSDELYLVKEEFLTSSDISNGYFSFDDNLSEDATGATLYTSPSQQTILQSNYPPPIAKDMCLYKGYSIYANTSSREISEANLTSVGRSVSSGGVQNPFGLSYVSAALDTTSADNTVEGFLSTATMTMSALTWTAANPGFAANDISIFYVPGVTAGSEVVQVSGSYAEVFIQSGVTDADQVKAAWDANSEAVALATLAVTGAGGTVQNTFPKPSFLSGGFDTTMINPGMRISGNGIPADTYVSSIIDNDSILIGKNATATGTPTLLIEDVFSVAGRKYFATNAPSVSNEFEAPVFFTEQNLYLTATDLATAINRDALQTVYAYDFKNGSLEFQSKVYGTSSFVVATTKPQAFTPPLQNFSYATNISVANPTQITSDSHGLTTGDEIIISGSTCTPSIDGTRVVTVIDPNTFTVPVNVTVGGFYAEYYKTDDFEYSASENLINAISFSKFQQPESVPIVNFLYVGSANFNILRVITLNEFVYIFKEREGIFRLSGDGPENFRIDLFDASCILVAPESAVVGDNKIFAYTEQGVEVITGDVQDVGAPIKTTLSVLQSPDFPNFVSSAFGISYETDNKYILYCVTEPEDTYPTQAFVFNYFTNSWTRWPLARTCGIIKAANGKMYSACPDPEYIFEERKNFGLGDYCDEEFAVTVVSSTGKIITLSSTTGLEAGMTISQGEYLSIITEVISSTEIEVVLDTNPWIAGAATVYEPIETILQWAPNSSKNPGILKQYPECTLFFRRVYFDEITLEVQSSVSLGFTPVTIAAPPSPSWGLLPWGVFPWGGSSGENEVPIRTYVPLEKQRASWVNFRVTLSQAFTNLNLQGISCIVEVMSSRFK